VVAAEPLNDRMALRGTSSLHRSPDIVEYFRAVSEGKRPKGGGPIVIDGAVKLPQTIDEAAFVKSIELKVWDKVAKISWRPFEEAREFARGLDLSSVRDWMIYINSYGLPPDVPYHPERIYGGHWVDWSDWLNTENLWVHDRKYLSFDDARSVIVKANLKNTTDWKQYSKINRPINIPSQPDHIYKSFGWKNWGHWLGTGRVADKDKEFLDFREARRFARTLNLKSAKEWRLHWKTHKRPNKVPSAPEQKYINKGWVGWSDWLGNTDNTRWRGFEDARSFVHGLNIRSVREWAIYCKSGQLPDDIPVKPDGPYKNQGFDGYNDWLGYEKKKMLPFEEARRFVRSLGLRSNAEWREYCRSGARPENVPSGPEQTYPEKWISWPDWLGTDKSY
jgi:hypothetical protein